MTALTKSSAPGSSSACLAATDNRSSAVTIHTRIWVSSSRRTSCCQPLVGVDPIGFQRIESEIECGGFLPEHTESPLALTRQSLRFLGHRGGNRHQSHLWIARFRQHDVFAADGSSHQFGQSRLRFANVHVDRHISKLGWPCRMVKFAALLRGKGAMRLCPVF